MSFVPNGFSKNPFSNNFTAKSFYEDFKCRVGNMPPVSWRDVTPHGQSSSQALTSPTNHIDYICSNGIHFTRQQSTLTTDAFPLVSLTAYEANQKWDVFFFNSNI